VSPATAAWLENLLGVRRDHSLAEHTTYRIGGRADWYLEVVTGLDGIVRGAHEHGIPLTLLGNGSNLLVADEGVEGLVVRPVDTSADVRDSVIHAAAGTRMVRLAQAAEKASLTGMEWALGIPGTVGGSIHNNAGCFGSDVAASVTAVQGVSSSGERETWTPSKLAFVYRGSALRDGALRGGAVVGAEFELANGDATAIRARMEEIQAERRRTQPVTNRSTGSVFKNPAGDFAARLIDAAGLKGRAVGGAMVSPDHANFIVNTGGASAADVAALVAVVQAAIEDRDGIHLEPEIEVIGRWPDGAPAAFSPVAAT
jgi:UDP-N-acetylmuramate dehydrogenase